MRPAKGPSAPHILARGPPGSISGLEGAHCRASHRGSAQPSEHCGPALLEETRVTSANHPRGSVAAPRAAGTLWLPELLGSRRPRSRLRASKALGTVVKSPCSRLRTQTPTQVLCQQDPAKSPKWPLSPQEALAASTQVHTSEQKRKRRRRHPGGRHLRPPPGPLPADPTSGP